MRLIYISPQIIVQITTALTKGFVEWVKILCVLNILGKLSELLELSKLLKDLDKVLETAHRLTLKPTLRNEITEKI